jgi:antirestriction protein ArdC
MCDYINMPAMESFVNSESYYGTLFHELIHSTGHASRLNRKEVTEMKGITSEPYSIEELTAELGACYLKSDAGIFTEADDNSAAYIQSWLSVLMNDKRFIVYASA